MNDYGRAVRMTMAKRQMTTTKVAKEMDVQPETVRRWMRGTGVTLRTLELLAEVCDMELDEVMAFSK